MKNERLNLFEAASIVAGLGIGGGIMAVPYLASLNGLIPTIIIFTLAYVLSILLHLMITEIILRNGRNLQLVETLGQYLFVGKYKAHLTWIFFGLVVLNFYTLLAAFLIGSATIISDMMGISIWMAKIIAYTFAAGPILFGLKALGISEKFGIIGIIVLVAILMAGSVGKPVNTILLFSHTPNTALALYGMVMFTFSCFFSIPQVAKGLGYDKKQTPKAVVLGITINLILLATITLMTTLVSRDVTDLAIIGWTNAIGTWAVHLGSGFIFLAILTSYWGTSYALVVVYQERLAWSYRLSWLVATAPTLLLAISGVSGFLGFMRIAGGLLAIVISIMIIPAFRGSRKNDAVTEPEFRLNVLGHPIFQWLIIIAYFFVAVGSAVPVT